MKKEITPDQRFKHKIQNLRSMYRLEFDDYMAILERQNFVCAICGTEPFDPSNRFCVDHCHSTGAVRGVLCTKCNYGLGFFKDDIAAIEKAADYIRRSRE